MRNGQQCLIYKEKQPKAYKGGLKDLKHKPKEVIHFHTNEENNKRNHIELFKKYLSLRPNQTKRFYLQPLQTPKGNCWYSRRPIGKNKLSKFVQETCLKSGVEGRKKLLCGRSCVGVVVIRNSLIFLSLTCYFCLCSSAQGNTVNIDLSEILQHIT